LLLNGRDNEPSARDNAPNPQTSVMARAEGPWQSIGFHPRDDVSLPFLPERRMAIPDYRASLLGLVKKAKCDCPVEAGTGPTPTHLSRVGKKVAHAQTPMPCHRKLHGNRLDSRFLPEDEMSRIALMSVFARLEYPRGNTPRAK
jgi:hypothetical protein